LCFVGWETDTNISGKKRSTSFFRKKQAKKNERNKRKRKETKNAKIMEKVTALHVIRLIWAIQFFFCGNNVANKKLSK
jgi:hypothetical protein